MYPTPDKLNGFSVAGITDLRNAAAAEHAALVASATPETVTDEQLTQLEELQSFVASADKELTERNERATKFAQKSEIPAAPKAVEPEKTAEVETVTAAVAELPAGTSDVSDTAVAPGDGTVVTATITAANATEPAPVRATPVNVAEIARNAPAPVVHEGEKPADYTIMASADIPGFATGATLTWDTLGKAFEERARPYEGMRRAGTKGRHQSPLAVIRRNFGAEKIIDAIDSHEQTYGKIKNVADAYGRTPDLAITAANGWCAPSEPDYSICNPITTDGLVNLPEMILRRGGLIHNQGLDFGDFFGDDFVLPIPGYNILTEAQVIADTAKTCVEIPCPAFVDDRLNVAALCLTGSLLQNRGYPEFVAEFTRGAIAAMAHLVNREVLNAIEAGSLAINLTAVDPWGSDGTVVSQLLSVLDFAATDLRYVYRASENQLVDVILPIWVKQALRADWLRRNATFTLDMTDAMVSQALAARNIRVQWVYDWQDAFDPANGLGAIDVNHRMGLASPTATYNSPTAVTFTAFLPGTWVLGRQDVVRLDTVYDSTLLAQNQVTQLFMEDGYLPMRMCQHSRAYTVNICPSGSTGVQRAVACTDVTP